MATSDNVSSDNKKICDMFDDAFELFNSFDKCPDPMNETTFQAKVKRCMHLFEETTKLVSAADIFSSNERYDELPTEHLRYFLLPAFLGELSLKLCNGSRTDIVNMADVYFKDFLSRCIDYGLSSRESNSRSISALPIDSSSGQHAQLTAMVGSRNAKLQKFREQKELENRLKILQECMDTKEVDEDTTRDYYITIIKMYVMKARDELDSLAMEKQILEHMEKAFEDYFVAEESESRCSSSSSHSRRRLPPKPLKPVIITKDEVQKAVYGAGYPSLPTFTVQEFYDQRVRDGIFPDSTKILPADLPKPLQQMTDEDIEAEQLKADEEKDQLEDDDDPEAIERARAMDEYKDDHRRGWGNRHNRS